MTKRILTAAVLFILLLSGCSVYKAVHQPPKKDTSVLHKNAARSLVISELGEPIYTEKTENGRMDIFKFTQGYSEGVKTSRAVLHGTADVLTLGLWEVVGTPAETIYSGNDVRLEAHYDKNDKLQSVNVLTDNLDIEDKSVLGTEGRTARQQEAADLLKTYREVRREYIFGESDRPRPESYALVIGIRNYKQNPEVPYADLSAMAFAELLHTTYGLPKENIIVLLNDEASSGQIKAKIALLKELANPKGDLYFYYAGHGVPGKHGNAYLLPADMSADTIQYEPSLQLDAVYRELAKAPARHAFVFLDSCFSGKDDSGELLYKGVAPVLKVKKGSVPRRKMTVMTAGKSTDFANALDEKRQRMFTYYLIEALSGGEKNLVKPYARVKYNVKKASLSKGTSYKQIPQLYGNPSAPLE